MVNSFLTAGLCCARGQYLRRYLSQKLHKISKYSRNRILFLCSDLPCSWLSLTPLLMMQVTHTPIFKWLLILIKAKCKMLMWGCGLRWYWLHCSLTNLMDERHSSRFTRCLVADGKGHMKHTAPTHKQRWYKHPHYCNCSRFNHST